MKRENKLARKLIDKALEIKNFSPNEKEAYLLGIRDGFKLCAIEITNNENDTN